MPATYTPDMGGERILATLRQSIRDAKASIVAAMRQDSPVEYRRAQRSAAVAVIERHVTEAQQAFNAWAARARDEANAIIKAVEPIGSAAEETRQLRMEMELGRLIEQGRRDEPRVINGKLVRNLSALDYDGEAFAAYLDGDYDRAITLAKASQALGGPERSATTLRESQAQLDLLRSPAKAAALRDLALVDRGVVVFSRDVNAAVSDAYQAAAEAALDVGDDPNGYRRNAYNASRAAKAMALTFAEVTGEPYAEPEGALSGAPTGGSVRSTDAMLAAITSRAE